MKIFRDTRRVYAGQTGIVFEKFPEAEAFSRWQNREFLKIEQLYAHEWRKTVTNLNLEEIATKFKNLGIDGETGKTLDHAKALATNVVSASDKPFDRMYLALLFLNIHPQYHHDILQRWSIMNYAPISVYAPFIVIHQ